MIGTIVNTATILTGSLIGSVVKKGIREEYQEGAKTNFSIAVDEDNVKDLSTTEWRIIQEVGYGESNKEIAAKLFLSEGTVRNYLSTILAKLNLRDRTQLAIWSDVYKRQAVFLPQSHLGLQRHRLLANSLQQGRFQDQI